MDPKDLRTLKILEAVEQEETPSQRDLARRLNVSLGLVNSFIKRLVNRGYFKATTIPKNRVKYMLTPKGIAEKTRLTYEYIQYSFLFYKDTRQRLKTLFARLESAGVRNVVFFGIGEVAEIAYLSLSETRIELAAVADLEAGKQRFLGRRILTVEELGHVDFDTVVVTAIDGVPLFLEALRNARIPERKIAPIEFQGVSG